MTNNNQRIWEERYARGEAANRYPYDLVVSFLLGSFSNLDKSQIKILDYGSGAGNHTAFLAREGFDYYAIDFSPSAIQLAHDNIRSFGLLPDENRIVCGDFKELPFEDYFFDGIIDRQSLDQNCFSDIPDLVNEIYRVLKPGGVYMGINFSDGHPDIPYGIPLGHGDYTDFSKGVFKGLGMRHFFGIEEVKFLFHRFDIVDIRVLRWNSALIAGRGSEELVVIAKKPES